MGRNLNKVYAIKEQTENRIKKICPEMPKRSGIYIFYRIDENGFKFCYCGQAKTLIERCASHLREYDHIALSLKKRGFYSPDNIYGWQLTYFECSIESLDEKEKETIKKMADKGYQLYNKTGGGQGKGKEKINEFRPAKGYRDGLEQGRKNLARELNHIIDKHLVISLKKETKVSKNALEKFYGLLNIEKENEDNE